MTIAAITSTSQATTVDTQRQAKLTDAAHQFEGMFLQELLKPMQTANNDLTGEDSSDASTDTLQSYGTEAVAKAISSRGGFGIARQVIQQVNRERQNTEKSLPSVVTKN